ncbi:DNA (cytosine-5)-methyltransferase PliMCI-like [Cloeon dipterum]|uniref:DNA (cytosine-5)-methyltransferase PliMCI-like n=1 Tax=Cloeon dipterum TaxID=197152 RepID=UPI0032205E41
MDSPGEEESFRTLRRPLRNANTREDEDHDLSPAASKGRKRRLLSNSMPATKKQKLSKDTTACCEDCGADLLTAASVTAPDDKFVDEPVILTDESLQLADSRQYDDSNGLPILQVSDAKFFCRNNHLCSIDSNVVETDKDLFMAGTIRAVEDTTVKLEQSSAGIVCQKSSTINEWFVSGYGTAHVNLWVVSEFGNYKIVSVAEEYVPFFSSVLNICHYANHLIKSMIESSDASLDEILADFSTSNNPLLTIPTLEELVENAQFIHAHVTAYFLEPYADGTNDAHLLSLPFYREFCDLANLDLRKKAKGRKVHVKKSKIALPSITKATTTPIVNEAFSLVFDEHMKIVGDSINHCNATSDEFEQKISTFEEIPDIGRNYIAGTSIGTFNSTLDYIKKIGIIQSSNSIIVEPGSFLRFSCNRKLVVKGRKLETPYFGQVQYLAKAREGAGHEGHCHVRLFMQSHETILETVADRREVFGSTSCVDVPFQDIQCTLPILHWLEYEKDAVPHQFYYKMRHDLDSGAFISLPNLKDVAERQGFKIKCECCEMIEKERLKHLVRPIPGPIKSFQYLGDVYCCNSFVLIQGLDEEIPKAPAKKTIKLDPSIYMEAFRKEKTRPPEVYYYPLDVCQIVSVDTEWNSQTLFDPYHVDLKVRLFRRAAQTKLQDTEKMSHHLLFYTDKVFKIKAKDILGVAYVAHKNFIRAKLEDWLESGEKRFYFRSSYDKDTLSNNLPFLAKQCQGAVNPKTGMGMAPPDHVKPSRRLKCLDVFAGCGGLSAGLHAGGLTDSRWACEVDKDAADAFQKNFPEAVVFNQDINSWLEDILSGKEKNVLNQRYPKVGEVEMIVGGPPCQGFSSMNRYHTGIAARFKNSLVATFFSIIEHYKPRYFLFENVKNFAISNQGLYLKTVIGCCLKLDYQLRYSVLQAGNFGAPQSRYRTIIIGARRGEILPQLPKVQYTLDLPAYTLALNGRQIADGTTYGLLGEETYKSAPFRAVNVYDAIGDLPDIPCGVTNSRSKYLPCCSSFQYNMRLKSKELKDHITRNLSALDKARIKCIPPGGDWRDMPNSRLLLEDGTTTVPLKYITKDGKRGVCPCNFVSKEDRKNVACIKRDERKSIVPWCLPHTADRHAHWAGLYGRVRLGGQFQTTVTIPEPMGKQGQVLHSTYDRCLSVRELARSQSIPDHFELSGSMEDRYRQVGNAVPPLLAASIARMFQT